MSVTAADEGVSRTTTTVDTDTAASSCTGEELSLKLESALSKLDLASIMLGGTENNSEVLKVSNTTCQSSPLSRPESWASRPAWLLLEGQSVQGFEKRPMFGAPPLLMRPNEQGQLDIGPTFPSFVPQTLSCYSETRPEELKRLFDLLIPSTTQPQIRLRPQHTARESRFFPKPPTEKVSCIPFPPLDADSFGLVQERLCRDPFRLLIAVTFLNKTRGKVALPVCYELFERYPTPEDLANADTEELGALIGGLGLQNQRGKRMIKLAQMWVEKPPQKGQRYRRLHYPKKNDGRDVKPDEPISDDDPRVAWEIAHLPGAGAYAIDSWRIFCRDELRGLPTGFPRTLSPAMIDEELQKEWSRVLPLDKELRAYLRWRWLRLGWNWNSLTGERHGVESDFLDKIRGGGVSLEGDGDCAVEAVYGVVDAGFGSDRQCRGSLSKIPNDDIVAMPEACRAVGGPREARSTDETLGRDPIAKDNSADADTIVVMGQGSVAPSQVDNLPKAVSSLTPRILNGEQLETREDTGSETSPAIEAALSWLHCDDIEDTPDAAMASVATQQAVVVEQLAVKSNPNGADPPCLSAHSESMIQPLSTQIEHVKASPENHNLPKGEMTGAQILRHRLRAVMRELPVAA